MVFIWQVQLLLPSVIIAFLRKLGISLLFISFINFVSLDLSWDLYPSSVSTSTGGGLGVEPFTRPLSSFSKKLENSQRTSISHAPPDPITVDKWQLAGVTPLPGVWGRPEHQRSGGPVSAFSCLSDFPNDPFPPFWYFRTGMSSSAYFQKEVWVLKVHFSLHSQVHLVSGQVLSCCAFLSSRQLMFLT